jgi:glutamate-1-semialdehyde aminotransferase
MDTRNKSANKIEKVELTRSGKGQRLYEEAKKIIPGGGQLLSKRPELILPDYWPAYYQKAKGCEVWDLDGNHYIDLSTMGIGSCTIGYADDDVNKAVGEAIKNGSMCTFNAPEETELAQLLIKLHPWAEMARFARSGGDAMAIAVRIARAATKKDIILFSGYHGWHDWYLSANIASNSALDGQLLPGLNPNGVARGMKGTSYPFFYNNTEEFLELIEKYEDKIGGVVLEAVRGMNPEPGFFLTIERETKRLGVPLIVDEVTSGFRLTCGGAHLVVGLSPDIAVFAKGMSNGYPMAAVIGKAKYMDAAQDSFISSTFWTERIGPTAAIATIKKMLRENVQAHLIECGRQIQCRWRQMAEKHNLNIHVSGIYPLSHLSFKDQPMAIKTLYIQEMLHRGFLVKDSYYSSFAHKQEHLDLYFVALDEVFEILADALRNNDVESRLKGPVCQSGFKRLV